MDVELIEGGGGVFDVSVAGRVLFSKKVEGRFPENAEIISRIAELGRDTS